MYRRLLIVAALVVVLLGGLWFLRHRIVTGAKEWRASSLVAKAEKAADEKQAREAVQFATAAWQLGPKKIGTLRRIMVHGREVGLPDLAAVTLLVFFHDEREASDREDILGWTLDRGDAAFFDQLSPNLDEAARATPKMRLLRARKLALQGRMLEALEETRALEGEVGLEDEVELLLAAILARMPGNPPAAKEAARRVAAMLAHEDDTIALGAWRMLPALPDAVRDPGPEFDPVAWIATREGATAADRVYARRLAVGRLPEEERDAAMDASAAELIADPTAVAAVVRWYLEAKRGGKLLDLPEAPFLTESSAFSSRLQVLLDAGRFDEAKAWLGKAPNDFPEAVSGSLAAVFARREGRSSEALTAWRRVIDRAANMQVYGECAMILRIAEVFGEEKAAADVVEVIAKLPPSRLPPSEQLEFLEPRFADRPAEWLAFWRGVARFRPGDAVATEQVAFLELGLGEDVGGVETEAVLARTEQVLRRFPGVPRFQATHALWLVRAGREDEALAKLREAGYNWNEADPIARAAYAFALRKGGAATEAEAMERGIRWEAVPPVRRALLLELLRSGNAVSHS